jgi:hypothetical protein
MSRTEKHQCACVVDLRVEVTSYTISFSFFFSFSMKPLHEFEVRTERFDGDFSQDDHGLLSLFVSVPLVK